MIAHVGGVPAEEALLPLVSGMGTALVLARAWVVSRTARPGRRSPVGTIQSAGD
ncbi:MAG: hypothetical protein LC792_22580 [Actinobacteria bacterium]|nr:hypothetical protein [Actinomycetota bacterium]